MPDPAAREMRRRQVPAVTRAIGILRLLGKSDEPIGVNQIARELELIPSTCLHILRVLVDEGLVAFDQVTKRYSVDIGILPIARSAIQRNSFINVVQRRLNDVSLKFGVTSIATQLSDAEYMVVVALSQAPLAFRLQVDLGSRFPALISATGRCFAAFGDFSEDELAQRFETLNWEHPPSFEEWHAQVAETKARGYGVDNGTYISGVTIIAVPVLDQRGRMMQSLVALGVTEKMESMGVGTIAAALIDIRDETANLLLGGKNGVGG